MCYNCGCGNPNDDMGSNDNITNATFESLAEKWKMDILGAKHKVFDFLESKKTQNESDIREVFEKAASAWGQPVEEAKRQVHQMLKWELKKK